MTEQRNVGFDAGSKRPRLVVGRLEQHGSHGVAVHHFVTVFCGSDEQTTVAVTVERRTDQLPRFSRLKSAQQCMTRGFCFINAPALGR